MFKVSLVLILDTNITLCIMSAEKIYYFIVQKHGGRHVKPRTLASAQKVMLDPPKQTGRTRLSS